MFFFIFFPLRGVGGWVRTLDGRRGGGDTKRGGGGIIIAKKQVDFKVRFM